MEYRVVHTREESREQLTALVESFREQFSSLFRDDYSEAQVRNDFLNPFLKSLGWDVDNIAGNSQLTREVIQEEPIDVDEGDVIRKKNPDYTLRIGGHRKFFLEAKKVKINIDNTPAAVFQTRRYGWSANLGMSLLTNFNQFAFYDCREAPSADDPAHHSRFKFFEYTEILGRFDEIYDLCSKESVESGYLDDNFAIEQFDTKSFDGYFLSQIESWRARFAVTIKSNNLTLTEEELNTLIQRLLNRIVFLRICEDRGIEQYETLRNVSTYEELKALFQESDRKYNSGLFNFIDDSLALEIEVPDDILIQVFSELYYPLSPYDFSIIEPIILSQIYEQYLGNKIVFSDGNGEVNIEQEPEVVESNGVVPTPKFIVDDIISRTMNILEARFDEDGFLGIKIADICCGSGTFMIGLFDALVEIQSEFFIRNNVTDNLTTSHDGSMRLSLASKRNLLLENLFGVDVNPYAVEVARFSLLLKMLEHEDSISIAQFISSSEERVLPSLAENIKCGNSLLDSTFYTFDPDARTDVELLLRIKPFDWSTEFSTIMRNGGFDAIVGNPPYVRIQNLVKYTPKEIAYYKSEVSPFSISSKDTIDKYYLFMERALSLLNDRGVLGYIVPHKFFVVKGGKKLRRLVTDSSNLSTIIHFGVSQVFAGRSTYTAIIILDKDPCEQLKLFRVGEINRNNLLGGISPAIYPSEDYSDTPWIFLSEQATDLFERVRNAGTIALKEIANIPVGLQTSADKIYIIREFVEHESTIEFIYDGISWHVEKEILEPCIYDLSLGLFKKPHPNAYMIFPYSVNEGGVELIEEEVLQETYPLSYTYLSHSRTMLEARSITGGRGEPVWYQYGRSQSLSKFNSGEKLIWSVLSTEQAYAYESRNLKFTGGGNGPYYAITPGEQYSILYILGLLAHPALEAMIKAGASEFSGAYYSHGQQFIENIPIKTVDFNNSEESEVYEDIINRVNILLEIQERIETDSSSTTRTVLQRRMDTERTALEDVVSSWYGITRDDINSVQGENLFNTAVEIEA